jgi:hypothetical protein
MAGVEGSGVFVVYVQSALTNAAAYNFTATTHKLALFSDINVVTPTTYEADTAYGGAPFNAGEVTTTTYWPAGGWALSAWPSGGSGGTASFDISTTHGSITFDASDVSKPTTTLASVMCALLYDDATSDKCMLVVDFVTAVSTSNGTFEIVWATPANGAIFRLDLTP